MIGYKLKDGTIVEGVTQVPLTADGKEIKLNDILRGSGGIFRVIKIKPDQFQVEHLGARVESWFWRSGYDFVHNVPKVGEVPCLCSRVLRDVISKMRAINCLRIGRIREAAVHLDIRLPDDCETLRDVEDYDRFPERFYWDMEALLTYLKEKGL